MSHFANLSGRQRLWLGGTLLTALVLAILGWAIEQTASRDAPPELSTRMTIRQIAPTLDATGFALAKELHLPRSVDKDTPLAELRVEQSQLDQVVGHLWSHRGRTLKYYLFAALSLFGLVWLLRLGRPDGSSASQRRAWYPRGPYLAAMLLAVVVCGFVLGKSPNPMEGVVKVFKGLAGQQPSMPAVILACAFFLVLAIVGNKLVCGWACPFGALQELLYSLPILKRAKQKKLPFWATNLVRGGLFVVMLLLLLGIVGNSQGFVLYHFVNPFNLFDLRFETPSILATVVVALGLALVTYRPYCQWICPFGFVSWLAERVSLSRVRVDHRRCSGCGACSRACPLPSAQHKVEGKTFGADCYSCARCLNVCPEQAITYSWVLKRPSKADPDR